MKKTLIAAALIGLSFGAVAQQPGFSPADIQTVSTGGFQNSTSGVTPAAKAKTMRDESWVVLEGNIVRQVEHERYEFRDNSGTIYVDIDDSDWMGQQASPGSRVRLEGEVDTDFGRTEIDVKRVSIIK